MRRSVSLLAIALLALTLPGGASLQGQAPRFYVAEDIGTFGTTYTEGLAINESGDIAGYAQLPSGDFHAFRYTDAFGLEDLGGAALGWFSQAFGINASGDVVGVFLDDNFVGHGFLAPAGSSMQDLLSEERPISMVTSITDDRRLAGSLYAASGETHAFRTLTGGGIQNLGTPGFNSTAWRMNAAGQVTGNEAPVTYPAAGRYTAFRFSDGAGKVDLGTLGGRHSFGLAISPAGVVVGCAELDNRRSHAFRSRDGLPMENLGTFGGEFSCAEGINSTGEIVGWSDLANHQRHAFVYTDAEGMIDLNTLVPGAPGLGLIYARAINDRGQIVAVSNTLAGLKTYRLTPIQGDSAAPVIASASVTPSTLWPPDGQMKAATVTVSVTDDVDPAPGCRVTGVSVLEGGLVVRGAAETEVQITGDLTLLLRARRSGSAARTYEAAVSCSDAAGNSAGTTVRVTVPHDASN
jgi:probable HAF family extracellular repeat protein